MYGVRVFHASSFLTCLGVQVNIGRFWIRASKSCFWKSDKYMANMKLSVGVGPVAIGTFLLAGGLLRVTSFGRPGLLRMHRYTHGLCHRKWISCEEQEASGTCYSKEYQRMRDTFYLVYKRKGDSQATLPQTGGILTQAATQVWDCNGDYGCSLFSKSIVNY